MVRHCEVAGVLKTGEFRSGPGQQRDLSHVRSEVAQACGGPCQLRKGAGMESNGVHRTMQLGVGENGEVRVVKEAKGGPGENT
jgi:hypothetical protein